MVQWKRLTAPANRWPLFWYSVEICRRSRARLCRPRCSDRPASRPTCEKIKWQKFVGRDSVCRSSRAFIPHRQCRSLPLGGAKCALSNRPLHTRNARIHARAQRPHLFFLPSENLCFSIPPVRNKRVENSQATVAVFMYATRHTRVHFECVCRTLASTRCAICAAIG